MKVYVSAKWQFKDLVDQMHEYLQGRGHEITSHWTSRAYARDYRQTRFQSISFSQEEVQAILSSDWLLHLSDGGGMGKYVDLGIALAGKTLQQKPHAIVVLGERADESQFYFHPAVLSVVTKDPLAALESIVAELERSR